jgi:DNA-binding transcriptional ArsR family regulator
MVVYGGDDTRADERFRALADPTRRDILRRVIVEEHSVSDLARRYPMSFAAVQKHVAVLERAGWVHKRRHGREQLVSGDREALRAVRRLLDTYETLWRGRVERMEHILAEDAVGGRRPDETH